MVHVVIVAVVEAVEYSGAGAAAVVERQAICELGEFGNEMLTMTTPGGYEGEGE